MFVDSLTKKLLFLALAIVLFGTFSFQKIKERIIFSNRNLAKTSNEKEGLSFQPGLLRWEMLSSNIPWAGRDAAMAEVFQNKIWLMGGLEGGEIKAGAPNYGEMSHKSDIWVSEDGRDWQLITDKAAWGERRSAGVVVFRDKIWLMGGWTKKYGETKNDVWVSEDGTNPVRNNISNGVNWKLVLNSAPWPAREGHSVVVFEDKIWLAGGVDFYKRKTMNDVWVSEDGIAWTEVASSTPWSKRYDHTLTIFKDKLWLIGGLDFGGDVKSDIWVSENGRDWQLVSDNPAWLPRHGHIALEYKDYLWIIGGWSETADKGLNDTWYSKDGYDWKKTKKDGLWLGREDHSAVVFEDKIWIMGGMADAGKEWVWKNDVWYSTFSQF